MAAGTCCTNSAGNGLKCIDSPSSFLSTELGSGKCRIDSFTQVRSRVIAFKKEIQECLSVTGYHFNGSSLRTLPLEACLLMVPQTSGLFLKVLFVILDP